MDLLQEIMGRFLARLSGPLNFRFILQPVMAILLGIRDGLHDAKTGTPPVLLDLFEKPKGRKRQLRKALRNLLVPLLLAIVLDVVVQYLLFGWVRLIGAMTIGVMVMGLPYVIARTLTNWIVTWRNRTSVSTSVRT
jgi:Na+/H+-translocating membrane pyrophosphatase